MEVDDIFDLFGGGGGRRKGPSQKQKGEDVVFPLAVSLEELYCGATKKIKITKNVICGPCKGKGGKSVQVCQSCRGQGVKMVVRQIGPGMITQMQQTCSSCKGQGQQIAESDRCKSCSGEKIVKETKTLEIYIPKGAKHGTKQVFRGEADEMPDTTPGDVVVVLQQKEHATFKRQSHHLFIKKTITLQEALCGYNFSISLLDKRVLVVKSNGKDDDIINPGDFRSIEDEGMPHNDNPNIKGNLYIEFSIEFPKKLDSKAKATLLTLLPKGAKESVPTTEDVEEVTMKKVNMDIEKKRIQEELEQAAEEEDDERRSHGHGQPACRQA